MSYQKWVFLEKTITEVNWDFLQETVKTSVQWIWSGFQIAFLIIFLYYMSVSAFAWIRRKETPVDSFSPRNRFAILVAAHNEEAVISDSVKSLKQLNYPKNLYEIFVIADNCTDETAAIARHMGAQVCERFDSIKKGKGHALEWMFEKILPLENGFDAVCILDADNLVSPNFLMEMNKQLCMGHEVVQGYLDSKNPTDSWIAGNNSIAFWISNRLFQLPRYYLGLSCILGGTGFIVSTRILREMGWQATCLTEDLEYSLRMVMQGKKVYWAHDAIIYDEKPLTISASWRQRKRWMQGHADCVRRFLKDLLVKAIREKNWVALDSCLYLLQPIIVVVNFGGMLLGIAITLVKVVEEMDAGVSFKIIDHLPLFLFSTAFMYISIMFILLEKKFSSMNIRHFILMPLYNFTWVPIIIQGFKDRDKQEWSHTVHTRSMDISEIEGDVEGKEHLKHAG